LIYYGIFFVQNSKSPIDVTGLVGAGFWVALFASVFLVLQVFVPRPVSTPIDQVNSDHRDDRIVVIIAYLGFIVLGMPGALLGVVTPYINDTFSLSLDAIGLLLLTVTVGYVVASAVCGRAISRLGAAWLFAGGLLLNVIGLTGYVVSPSWGAMVVCGLFSGLGAGFFDVGLNIYFAAHFGPRLMNWLHACFGIGATVAPLVMTALLNRGADWRSGYVLIVVLFLIVIALIMLTRSRWDSPGANQTTAAAESVPAMETLRLPLVWIGIGLFLAYAGLESTAGQWVYSLFTEMRNVKPETAGLWVSIYWGSFTVGRIFFGAIVNWVSAALLIRLCTAGAAVGGLLLWLHPTMELSFAGLALYGFALAPIFALLVTNTQDVLGPKHGANAIGFQMAAAGMGLGVLPGLAGVLAANTSLEVVPPFLMVLVVVMAVLYELTHNRRLAKS
jgi:fucose permease